jgi:hypothetical protein
MIKVQTMLGCEKKDMHGVKVCMGQCMFIYEIKAVSSTLLAIVDKQGK